MFMDKTTESITYFIGLFQTVTENVSSRIEYDSFRFFRKQQSLDPVLEQSAGREFIYGPDGYDPQAQDTVPYVFPAAVAALKPIQISSDIPLHFNAYVPLANGAPVSASFIGWGPELPPILELPPPNSVLHVTWQVNTLTDQDILDISLPTALAFVQEQGEILAGLQAQGEQLQVVPPASFALSDIAGGTGSAEAASDLFTQIVAGSEAAAAHIPEASVHLVTGMAVQGVTVDGQSVQKMPLLQGLLPQTLLSEQDADREGEAVAHTRITTGGNLALNEAVSVGGGVDASIIAVGGDVVNLDVISQVNVLRDDAAQPEADNQVLNVASFSGLPTQAATPDTGGPGFLPDLVTLATIEGDLITYDWIRQINAIGDEDTISFTCSGNGSFISTGENQAINADAVITPGMAYDLIIVEGNYIVENVVSQTNILLDDDTVLMSFLPGGRGASPEASVAQTSGNALINSASITHTAVDQISALSAEFRELLGDFDPAAPDLSSVLTSALLAPMEVMSVLYIAGDLLQLREVTQVNVISDSDLIDISGTGGTGMAGTITAGGNAAVNIAALTDVGLPSQVMAGGAVYSDAVLHQANLISDDAAPANVKLAADPGGMLASEAVVFLADDAVAGTSGGMDHGDGCVPVSEDGPPHLDVMQTMLA